MESNDNMTCQTYLKKNELGIYLVEQIDPSSPFFKLGEWFFLFFQPLQGASTMRSTILTLRGKSFSASNKDDNIHKSEAYQIRLKNSTLYLDNSKNKYNSMKSLEPNGGRSRLLIMPYFPSNNYYKIMFITAMKKYRVFNLFQIIQFC